MKQLMNIIKILKRPYPLDRCIIKKIISIISFGLFIFLFLFLFQPFGLQGLKSKTLIIFTGGFGVITSAYLIIHLFIFESFLSEKKWTLGKEIINTLIIITLIGLLNFIYYSIYFNLSLKLNKLIEFQLITLTVGSIPVFLFIFFKQNSLLKTYLKEAQEINEKKIDKVQEDFCNKLITINAQNPKNNFNCNCKDIFYILAQDNYVIIYYLKENNISKEIIRTTLKLTQDDLSDYPEFYRCHKSYIVNLNRVINVSGNAKGLKLKLNLIDDIIPVSRQLLKEFSEIYCTS